MRQNVLIFISRLAFTTALIFISNALNAQQTPAMPSTSVPSIKAAENIEGDSVTMTIIFKHQQNKNLPEIRRILEAQGFWELFPPSDVRVVSWTLAMGLGHIVTLKLPAGAIRRLNLAVENGAWGAFDTEFYITYDYKPIWEEYLEKRADSKDERN
jgi:hypothetical protein